MATKYTRRWGTTLIQLREIEIFIHTDADKIGAWAYTDWDAKLQKPFIVLSPDLLDRPAEILDESLMHEFIHCLEFVFPKELKEKPKNCTAAATVFGRHLPGMLKHIRQEGVTAEALPTRGKGSRRRRTRG